jgi:hypothetical protein
MMLRDPFTDREMHREIDVIERHEGREHEHHRDIERDYRGPMRAQRTQPLRPPGRRAPWLIHVAKCATRIFMNHSFHHSSMPVGPGVGCTLA